MEPPSGSGIGGGTLLHGCRNISVLITDCSCILFSNLQPCRHLAFGLSFTATAKGANAPEWSHYSACRKLLRVLTLGMNRRILSRWCGSGLHFLHLHDHPLYNSL